MIELKLAAFSEHVGSSFRLSAEGIQPLEVTLAEASSLASDDANRDESVRAEPFSLLFQSASLEPLPQQMYQLEHASLGTLDLFLVPVGPDKDNTGMCYEAVFN